jgi:hypothetical protein
MAISRFIVHDNVCHMERKINYFIIYLFYLFYLNTQRWTLPDSLG